MGRTVRGAAVVFALTRVFTADEIAAGVAFGTGEANTLGGHTGAVPLGGFALFMAWESVARLLDPTAVAFDRAIAGAVPGSTFPMARRSPRETGGGGRAYPSSARCRLC